MSLAVDYGLSLPTICFRMQLLYLSVEDYACCSSDDGRIGSNRALLQSINGVVFPGGNADLHARNGFAEAASQIYDIVLEMNLKGDHFPILGICQGFQTLAFLANNRTDILKSCDAENVNLPLVFKPDFRKGSLFSGFSDDDILVLGSLPVTSNHHCFCLTEKNLTRFGLIGEWQVLTTNHDGTGTNFVSSMERYGQPLAGVQFHPEKNAFEWEERQNNPHFLKAVQSVRGFYDWLVREARKNNHSFPNRGEENDSLIYNYNPKFTGRNGSLATQVYFFENTEFYSENDVFVRQ